MAAVGDHPRSQEARKYSSCLARPEFSIRNDNQKQKHTPGIYVCV